MIKSIINTITQTGDKTQQMQHKIKWNLKRESKTKSRIKIKIEREK